MNKNIKSLIIVLFVLIPILLFSKDKTYLEYWTPFTGGDARPMQFIVDKFNSSQDEIVVNMKVIEWAKYYPLLLKSINTKKSPDVAIVHASKLSEFISSNLLKELKDIKTEQFTKKTINSVRFNSKLYGVPIDTHLLLAYYNKEYIDKLENKMSENEFIEFFKTLQTKLPKDVVALGQPIDNVFPFWIWYTFYNQIDGGGKYIENNKAVFNNKAGLKALNFLVKLRDEGIYKKQINDTQGYNMFKYGKSSVFFTGGWANWNFEQNKDLDFGVAPFMQVFDKPATWSDSHTLSIPIGVDEKKYESILKFSNFVAFEGLIWSSAGHIPSNKTVLNSNEYKENTKRSKYSKYLEFSYSMPKHKNLWLCNEIMIRIFSDMMQSNKTAQETLNYAQDEVDKVLKENR
ncbi:MAG: extracellular solute-binding protein [Campylobacterota bacterium]|nr:extracellular solute-binding protein [Campylobacterota bacterium]